MEKAQALIAAGRGRELMLVPGWWFVVGTKGFVDRMTQMPDILALAPFVRCPVLFIPRRQRTARP